MRAFLRSTPARLWLAAFSGALIAAVLLAANPFPSGVYGQQPTVGGTIQGTVNQNPAQVLGATGQGSAPTVAGQVRPAVTQQQPVALPRTGVGLAADSDVTSGLIYGLLALAAGLGAAGVLARARHRP